MQATGDGEGDGKLMVDQIEPTGDEKGAGSDTPPNPVSSAADDSCHASELESDDSYTRICMGWNVPALGLLVWSWTGLSLNTSSWYCVSAAAIVFGSSCGGIMSIMTRGDRRFTMWATVISFLASCFLAACKLITSKLDTNASVLIGAGVAGLVSSGIYRLITYYKDSKVDQKKEPLLPRP